MKRYHKVMIDFQFGRGRHMYKVMTEATEQQAEAEAKRLLQCHKAKGLPLPLKTELDFDDEAPRKVLGLGCTDTGKAVKRQG